MSYAVQSGRWLDVYSDDGRRVESWAASVRQDRDVALTARGWIRVGEWVPNAEGASALVFRPVRAVTR